MENVENFEQQENGLMAGKSVLIIENDLFFISKITAILKQIGLQTLLVSNHSELCKILKEKSFDLIILDLAMEGLDTITLLQQIKTRNTTAHIPVIGFAEHSETKLLSGAREAGCEMVTTNRELVQDLKDLVEASLT